MLTEMNFTLTRKMVESEFDNKHKYTLKKRKFQLFGSFPQKAGGLSESTRIHLVNPFHKRLRN